MEKGYLALILHAHLPYVRHPEYENCLEEHWLHEAITESYIPLLLVLEGLVKDQIDFRLTLSITPTLVSMLGDPLLRSRYLRRLDCLIELAEKEMHRTSLQPEFNKLALMYHEKFLKVKQAFLRCHGDLVQAFKKLQDLGKVEILASAATHGYLPLFSVNPRVLRAQIEVGIDFYEKVFARKPKGFWLPECGYHPGVEDLLREHRIRYTILEAHGITHAEPRPIDGVYAPVYCPSGVVAFGRDPESSKQVWSSVEGYPGDFDYREFYRDIAYDLPFDYIRPHIHQAGIRIDTGLKYYRITGKEKHKEVYVPAAAEKKTEIHADHFISGREKQIEFLASVMDRKAILVAPYDAELFGHWWFEGPNWINSLIRKIAQGQKTFRLVTLSEYLQEYPINQVSSPSISSWGYKGFNEVWLNGKNDWMYRHLYRSAELMERTTRNHSRARGLAKRALKQALRELLLAQSSDWPFIIKSGTMADYAAKRVKTHLLRFNRLCDQIEEKAIDRAWLTAIEEQDNIFPQIDYSAFS